MTFDTDFTALIGNEGGYTANPNDAGNWSSGEVGVGMLDGTMWGISAPVARRHGYYGKMSELPLATAKTIAYSEYYAPYGCDKINPEIAFQVFDAAYNGGRPAQWLQVAAGVPVDGHIGPNTIATVNAADPDKIVMRFDAQRLRYLASLKSWPTFGAGWVNRIAANLERASNT